MVLDVVCYGQGVSILKREDSRVAVKECPFFFLPQQCIVWMSIETNREDFGPIAGQVSAGKVVEDIRRALFPVHCTVSSVEKFQKQIKLQLTNR